MTEPSERDRKLAHKWALKWFGDGFGGADLNATDIDDLIGVIAAARAEGDKAGFDRAVAEFRRQAEKIRAACGDEWEPIETAPKDGTVIDLWRHYPKTGIAGRVPNCHWGDFEEGDDPVFTRGQAQGWFGDDDEPIEWGPDAYGQSCVVTHWQPKPEPPK